MYKIRGKDGISIEAINKDYYLKLNEQKKDKTYKSNSIIYKINQKKIEHAINNNYKAENFYKILAKKNYRLLRNIITGKPKKLQSYIRFFEELQKNNKIPKLYVFTNRLYKSSRFGEEVLNVFGYSNLRSNQVGSWLANKLDIQVCPYCNLEFAYNVGNKLFYQLDHFVPKVFAPYLSASFYNLIPSCSTCNTQGKGTEIYNISKNINPYTSDFNRIVTIEPNIGELQINNKAPLKVDFQIKPKNDKYLSKANNYVNDFLLKTRYNRDSNLKEVKRLISVSEQYSDSAKQELINYRHKIAPHLTRKKIESILLSEHCIPVDDHEASCEVIGKLKLDVSKILKIIS